MFQSTALLAEMPCSTCPDCPFPCPQMPRGPRCTHVTLPGPHASRPAGFPWHSGTTPVPLTCLPATPLPLAYLTVQVFPPLEHLLQLPCSVPRQLRHVFLTLGHFVHNFMHIISELSHLLPSALESRSQKVARASWHHASCRRQAPLQRRRTGTGWKSLRVTGGGIG